MSEMRVVKKDSLERGIQVKAGCIPAINENEVLVKVKIAGICGTDLHIYQWDEWAKKRIVPPLTIGHEFVGEICQIGNNVKHLTTGQRVSAEGHIVCGRCHYCRNGQAHICQNCKIIGVDMDGCFADYIKIPASNIWPILDAIPDKHAAIFDPLGNAMHAVTAEPVCSKNVLITGAGAIGLFAIPIAKANGASSVIVIEPNPYKRDIAEKLGADLVLDPLDKGLKQKVLQFTQNEGVDVHLEMSGNNEAIRLGLDLLCNGGTVSLLGIPSKETSLDLAQEVIFKGITLRGITGRRMFTTWYQCQNFLLKHGSTIQPIITHSFEFNDIAEGFRLMDASQAAKVLVNIN